MKTAVSIVLAATAALVRGADPLTSVESVRALSPAELRQSLPVRLEGVVTHYQRDETPDFWIQDATGGIYIFGKDSPIPGGALTPGQRVRITGVSSARTFAPGVVSSAVEVIGAGPLPEPVRVSLDDLLAGDREGEYVEIAGVIREARMSEQNNVPVWELRFARDRGRLRIVIPHIQGGPPATLVDSAVVVRGVTNAFRELSAQSFARLVRVSSPADITVTRPAPPDPFALPEKSLQELLRFVPRGISQHRVHVRGTVTLAQPGTRCFIQQGDQGLHVLSPGVPGLALGEEVEIAGFPAFGDSMPYLENAIFRRTGKSSPVTPLALPAGELRKVYLANRLVETEGTLADRIPGADRVTLLLREPDLLLQAVLPEFVDSAVQMEWVAGSRVRLTGVALDSGEDAVSPSSPPDSGALRLLLRSPADVRVLKEASWWTTPRLWALVGIIGTVLAAVFGWAGALRRKVRRRTAQLGEEIRARRDERAAFTAVRTERTRLAAELHDGIEQLLTSASWQLEAAYAAPPGTPAARVPMTLAGRLLHRCREEVRRSVWDLRAQSLDRGDLPAAIRDALDHLNLRHDANATLTVRGAAAPVPPDIAGNTLRIAQEAAANALRHGAPTAVRLTLEYADNAVILTVEDDGAGFDIASPPGPEAGHFGLSGMRERARRIGGDLRLSSAPGKTTLRLAVPLTTATAVSHEPDLSADPPAARG